FASRDEAAHFAHWQRILVNPEGRTRTIVEGDTVVGNMVSFVKGGQRLVGYWIGREFWGRGIASRALAAFLSVETERPLFAHVAEQILGSQRLLEKCGFRLVGQEPGPEVPGLPPVMDRVYRLDATPGDTP